MSKCQPKLQPVVDFIKTNSTDSIPRALREVTYLGKNDIAAMLIAYAVTANLPIKHYINAPSSNGRTTLHWAASQAWKTKDNSLVELLLTYEPDTTILDKAGNLYSDYLKGSFNKSASSSSTTSSTIDKEVIVTPIKALTQLPPTQFFMPVNALPDGEYKKTAQIAEQFPKGFEVQEDKQKTSSVRERTQLSNKHQLEAVPVETSKNSATGLDDDDRELLHMCRIS